MNIEHLQIEDIEFKGKGIGRHNGKVIFVDNALPGEEVDVKVFQNKRDHAFARPTQFHQLSESRVEAFCKHFGTCGGCKWQNVSYEKQLELKRYFVVEAFRRIGKLEFPEVLPTLPSEQTQYYRNKLDFSCSNMRWLTNEEVQAEDAVDTRNAIGFHIPGRFDKVLDVEHCYLQPDPSNEIRLAVKQYALEQGFTFYDLREKHGFLRQVLIRNSNTGGLMVIVAFWENDQAAIRGLMTHLQNKFPQITSLFYTVTKNVNDTLIGAEMQLFAGVPYIEEKLGEVILRIGPLSFYQTNSAQAKRLYDVAVDFAGLKGGEVVYDLYTGLGSIALYIAAKCKEVIGIEEVRASIDDARANAECNNITNARFFVGDMKDVFNTELVAELPKPDVIITDPPRAGMHPKVLKMLLQLEVPRMVYVSCNPVTQARDLSELCQKYTIKKVQPVDMFPQTFHIESVALLELKQ